MPTSNQSQKFSDQARQKSGQVASAAADIGRDAADRFVTEPAQDLFALAKQYAKENPDVAACWAFGLGVLIGWKLKP